MQFLKRRHIQSICAKTDKNLKHKSKHCWVRWIFPVAGLASLIWFLLRVIPKPSRALYPCQRVAFPLASGFVAWLLGLAGSIAAFRKAKLSFAQRRYILGLICVAVSVGAIWLALSATGEKLVLAEPQPTNQPIGVAKGIYPGRVVWAHDPDATNWNGPGDGHPWESSHTNRERVYQMMSHALDELTGATSDAEAWDKLFRHHNKTRGKGDVGYKPGEKIAIKVNFVGLMGRRGRANKENYNLKGRDYMNTSPQMILVLLRHLVGTVGVKESDISVGETLAYFVNEYYNILHKEFPNVRYEDCAGDFGRIQAKRSSVPLYWSCHPEGCEQDYVPVSFAEADYLINLANLKAHTGAGVTLCAKNHYGSLIRYPPQKGYYDMHKSAFSKEVKVYRPLVDLMGHSHLGGKTVLYLIDGLYCGIHATDRAPRKWKSYPFDGDWTSSLFASQDPVAIDSVGFDFLYAEYETHPRKRGVDDYLHEAALANNPPSGTFYDPDHEGDVKRLASLGVQEHWNNPKDKQYSRNLGTGEGIELVAVTPASAKRPSVVAEGAKLIKLVNGFKFAEGPAADAEGNIYFSDIPNNRIHKWSPDSKMLSTFRENSGGSNGLYFDKDGNLLACEDTGRRLVSIDKNGNVTVLADKYQDKPFNSLNDLWIDQNGGVYFTDPRYGNRDDMEQDGEHVYYLTPDRKQIIRVINDMVRPNGVIGTPDGKLLYVADLGAKKTYVYNINEDGTLSNKKLFCSMGSDGMTIDNEGNVYLTGDSVTVFNSAGEKMEYINVPADWTANVCFGGKDRHTLFITAQKSLYSIQMRAKGV